MCKNWNNLRLLLWKNWVLQYRKKLQTVVEICAPVIFTILIAIIRRAVDPEDHEDIHFRHFSAFEPIDDDHNKAESPSKNLTIPPLNILYAPESVYLNNKFKMMEEIAKVFRISIKTIGFKNSNLLDHYYMKHLNTTYAAFEIYEENNHTKVFIRLPSELKISSSLIGKSTWDTKSLFPSYQIAGPRYSKKFQGWGPSYFDEGFLFLHGLSAIMLSINDLSNLFETIPIMNAYRNINLKRFPHAAWTEDPLIEAIISLSGMVILLSFVYTCINTVKSVTAEKEKQLKEAMKIMGLSGWLHWTAWFLKSAIFMVLSCVLITCFLCLKVLTNSPFSVFTRGNIAIIFIFFVLYVFSVITFCFAISAFFSKANTASAVAPFIWFFAFLPYYFLNGHYNYLSLAEKLIACLGMNSAMAFGITVMLRYEGSGEGIQWNNLWSPVTVDDNLFLGHIFIMFIVDTILYLLICFYVENVFPGEFGTRKPWYFFVTTEYWCGKRLFRVQHQDTPPPTPNQDFFEKEPTNTKAGIKVTELFKKYNENIAVNFLTINMYENQITVLLGHNGAGKTTTMSMLTGMIPPTSGTALIYGYDINREMTSARHYLGYCPQHNILFDELTVNEHLYFYSKLKGLNKQEIADETKKYLKLLELEPKANSLSCTLSGGMKRKLCVAIAMCGGSKVVMLDEPTAGMDPSARRALWDLIQKQKHGRTILLSTHFMDEADLLGDRIAIMAGGVLQCCGSSFFLKKKFGAGYYLVMTKDNNCNPEKVTFLLKEFIPNISINSNIGSELSYTLEDTYSSVFEKMLQKLEVNMKALGILSFGISLTTMEEVFMKAGADHLQGAKDDDRLKQVREESLSHIKNQELLTGCKLMFNQCEAMILKKFLSTLTSWFIAIITFVLPLLFVLFVIFLHKSETISHHLPSLHLSDTIYKGTVLIEKGKNLDTIYINQLQIKHLVVDSISNFMIAQTKENPAQTRKTYLIGYTSPASPKDPSIAWFNGDGLHAIAISYSLALSATYKRITNKTVSFYNYPLPYKPVSDIFRLTFGFELAFNLGFSFTFVTSLFILFYIRERVCKSKHLQFVSGIRVYTFWITAFVFDLLMFSITALLLVATLAAFKVPGFDSLGQLTRVYLILVGLGYAALPMIYLAAYLFDTPTSGFSRMCLFSIFTGDMALLIISIMKTPVLKLEHTADILQEVFMFVPHYTMCNGIKVVGEMYYFYLLADKLKKIVCKPSEIKLDKCWDMFCDKFPVSPEFHSFCKAHGLSYYSFQYPGLGYTFVYFFFVGTLLFIIICIIDLKVFHSVIEILSKRSYHKPEVIENEDSDVAAERKMIHDTNEKELFKQFILTAKDMTKYYGRFRAVNGVCLGVKERECFGLLGVNGAGKTSSFKMLTGDVKITYGDAWVKGVSVKNHIKAVQQMIGYCPQFDALLDDLTCEETLRVYCLLRGIRRKEMAALSWALAEQFDFSKHFKKKTKNLSGGNKRKLSTAISLIGAPPVLYLDEPTTGMDPATKRYLWDALCQIRDSGHSIVLTSHSMEECEALCTRLAVMVNGNFQCLGSTQHLKNKYAQGFSLILKLSKDKDPSKGDQKIKGVKKFVKDQFHNVQLKEEHEELLTYYLLDTSIAWSRMFGIMESGKKSLDIEDYSLGQCTLEQVFLTFTKYQQEDTRLT